PCRPAAKLLMSRPFGPKGLLCTKWCRYQETHIQSNVPNEAITVLRPGSFCRAIQSANSTVASRASLPSRSSCSNIWTGFVHIIVLACRRVADGSYHFLRGLTRSETMDHPGACGQFGACWRSCSRMVLRFSPDSSACGCSVESNSNTNTSTYPNARHPMVWRSGYLGPTRHSGSQNRVRQCQRFQSIRVDCEPEFRRTERLQWFGGLGIGGFVDSRRRVL